MTASAVVPTLGRTPLLIPCLEALRAQGAEIILVDQGEAPVEIPAGLADRILRPGRNLGFAAGTNLGIEAAKGEWIATVNDDAVVEPGWLAGLTAALEADPRAAAAQGINLQLDAPEIADGCGIAWNRWWQAVQIGHGRMAPPTSSGAREIFGVSATAALFRRSALRAAAPDGKVFDPRLGSYYEDVDLAGRLWAEGFRALLVPAARARHAGSATGRTLSRERWRLIYGNRYLTAARLLGRSFWPRLPRMAARDAVDLAQATLGGDGALAAGILSGWARAARHLPGFTHGGPPLVPLGEIRRFR
ncbi:MAG TPA: glycosyltransferase family 2 protein [Thermoanaerobaculia bacterium]|nr:glycosyltransferase family 2 protein [Thermoanaerobaculia bacterium]